VPNAVFPTGPLLPGDERRMHCGARDLCVGLAPARLRDILNTLEPGR